MLTREQLLDSFQLRYRDVKTRIGTLRIRNLTEGDKADFEAGSLKSDGKLNMSYVRTQRRRLIALVLVDDEGNQLLTEAEDVTRLKSLDAAVTAELFSAATDHCGFSVDEIDELEKNYGEATADDSPTA